jgi:hypothetical protein
MTADQFATGVFVAIGGVLAWAFWRAAQPKPMFEVRLIDGRTQAVHGTVTPAFMERLQEVAVANEVSQCAVWGYAHGPHIRLKFSAEMTEEGRQQLRNWWATFGWAAPRSCRTERCG